jgi:hypothetical protein
MPTNDFGRYLQSVAERDIDLLLMEEFHVSPQFAAWFASKVGLGAAAMFDGAWHSLNDEEGETDLLLRVRAAGERVGVLIENKVSAPAQPEQDVRYHFRGRRAKEQGRFDRFVTAICAPEIYLAGLEDNTAYEARVSYEAIRDWYAAQDGRRANWRRSIMSEAIEQGRRGYTMKVHTGKTAFHMAYWLYIQEHHPEFVMARPGPKGPKSNWIRFKAPDFPKGVTLNHKNDQACMDLEFESTTPAELALCRSRDWPEAARVLRRGNSAAISLPIPACDFDQPLYVQAEKVGEAIRAARQLAPLAGVLRERRG